MNNVDTPQELTVAPGCLLTFTDDTGHEQFAGDQPYYGLGSCAVPLEYYDELKFHWKRVRAIVTGDPNKPLHASELPRTDKAVAAVAEFFRLPRFFRLGAVATSNMTLPTSLHTAKPVIEILKKNVAAAVSRSSCSSVALVFERSQRGDPLLYEQFGTLDLELDGKPFPVEHFIMPKSANEIGLEVADFVANACGSQARRELRKQKGFALDYQAVFQSVPRALVHFMLIDSVTGEEPNEMAAGRALR